MPFFSGGSFWSPEIDHNSPATKAGGMLAVWGHKRKAKTYRWLYAWKDVSICYQRESTVKATQWGDWCQSDGYIQKSTTMHPAGRVWKRGSPLTCWWGMQTLFGHYGRQCGDLLKVTRKRELPIWLTVSYRHHTGNGIERDIVTFNVSLLFICASQGIKAAGVISRQMD